MIRPPFWVPKSTLLGRSEAPSPRQGFNRPEAQKRNQKRDQKGTKKSKISEKKGPRGIEV